MTSNPEDGTPEFDGHGSPRRTIRVEPSDDDRPLSDFMARHCPELPAGFMKKLIRKKYVQVDGEPGDLKTRMESGQTVKLHLPQGSYMVAPNANVPFRIAYEDDALVVVDKPYGIVSEPGIGHKLDTLLNGLIARYGEPMDRLGPECDYGMAHRLDRDTSGLLIVAKDAESWEAMTKQFRQKTIEKKYVVLVSGHLEKPAGRITIPLGRERQGGRMRGTIGGNGSNRAETSYKEIERFKSASLIEAHPLTGRWHQIRLHFAELGHPVAGDPEHGDESFNERMKSFGLNRMFLHSGSVAFKHPRTGKPVQIASTLPDDLAQVIKRLRSGG